MSEYLGKEKISSLLYRMSVPAITGLVINSLYNVIDTIFIGQGVGPMAIGGLAVAFPVQLLAVGLANLVGVGAASAVSRNLGAGNPAKASRAAGNAYGLIAVISLVFTVLGLLFTEPLLRVFGGTETLLPYALGYIRIVLGGNLFFSLAVTAQAIIQGEGRAKVAMTATVIGGLLNIALDPVFIFGFGLGIKGAAIATVISQFASFLYVMAYILRGKSSLKVRTADLMPSWGIVKEIFAVGSSAFARTTTNTIFFIVINNSLRYYGGDMGIATFGVVNRIAAFLFLPVFGIVQGMQPIAGYNYGARQLERVRQVVTLAIISSTAIGLGGLLIGQSIPHLIIRAFTSDQELIANGAFVLRVIIAAIPFVGIQFVGATLFQALGKSGPAIVLSLLRQFILLTPLVLALPRIAGMGLLGIWLAFPIADIFALVITLSLIRGEMKKWDGVAQLKQEEPVLT